MGVRDAETVEVDVKALQPTRREGKLRACPYTRVSSRTSAEDKEGTKLSTRQQEKHSRQYIDQQDDMVFGEVYSDNESASSYAKRGRPDWQRLLSDISDGRVDVLVLWEPSRATRDMQVWVSLAELCADKNVLIVANGRRYDLRVPQDKFQLHIFFAMEELNAAQIAQRVVRDSSEKAATGAPGPGKAPFGYRRTYNPVTMAPESFAPDTEERVAVRLKVSLIRGPGQSTVTRWNPVELVLSIFSLFLTGVPVHQIAVRLNAQGIPNPLTDYALRAHPKRKRTYRAEWAASMITRMIQNPAYLGQRRYWGTIMEVEKVQWSGFVDEETFYSAQNKLHERKKGPRTRPLSSKHLLSGIALCGECERPVKISYANKKVGYCCPTGRMWIPAEVVEPYVTRFILAWLTDERNLARVQDPVNTAAELAKLRGDLERKRVELQRWRSDPAIDIDTFKERQAILKPEIEALERELRTIGVPPVLKDVIGPQATQVWINDLELPARREIVKWCLKITLNPIGRGWPKVPITERVKIEISQNLAA
jgi:DNA invertase Pin-like site-specific DNA recombinase